MTDRFDVFISYKREERALAEQTAAALEAAGYTQVTDLNLKHSEHFGDAIDRMIREARLVLVLWTPAAASSEWVRNEARLASELNTYLGIMVEQTDLPVYLKYKQYLDLEGAGLSQSLPRVIETVRDKLGAPPNTGQIAAERSARLAEERELFETVHALDSVAGYQAYLEKYPGGVLSGVARERIAALKTIGYRLRRILPGAAAIGAFAGFLALVLQAFFSDEADAYFERREKLAAAEAARDRIQTQLEEAPNAEAYAALQAKVAQLTEALAAAPTPEDMRRLQDNLAAAPHPEEFARLQALEAELRPEATRPTKVPDPDCNKFDGSPGYLFPGQDCVGLTETELDLSATAITDQQIPKLAGLKSLQSLKLGGARVSNIDPLAGLTSLQSLDLYDTQVSDIAPLAGLLELASLNLRGTQVSDLRPLAEHTALQYLNLNGTSVSELASLAGLTALEDLDLGGTQVSDISALAELTALEFLNLRDTLVSDIAPLAGLTKLQFLALSHTQVSDITPLAELTALIALYLRNTQVWDITPLAGLTALETLDLAENTQITDISPLRGLTELRRLDTPDGERLGGPTNAYAYRREVRNWIADSR